MRRGAPGWPRDYQEVRSLSGGRAGAQRCRHDEQQPHRPRRGRHRSIEWNRRRHRTAARTGRRRSRAAGQAQGSHRRTRRRDRRRRARGGGGGGGGAERGGRPARRSAGVPGVVLPSLRRTPPRVSVLIDTSGSVSDTELGSALLEVAAISRAVGGRRDLVTVLSCDAAARIVHPLCRAERIPLVGGGGTDLRTGIAKALRAQPGPDVLVILTDGQTPWPTRRPPCRTVVGLFRRQHAASWREHDPDYVPDAPPAWARVVDIG